MIKVGEYTQPRLFNEWQYRTPLGIPPVIEMLSGGGRLPTRIEAEAAVHEVGKLIVRFREEDRPKIQCLNADDTRTVINI